MVKSLREASSKGVPGFFSVDLSASFDKIKFACRTYDLRDATVCIGFTSEPDKVTLEAHNPGCASLEMFALLRIGDDFAD